MARDKRTPELQAAIKAAGNITRLAREIGVTRQAVQIWRDIPVDSLAEVSRVTGLHPAELRPDLAALFTSKR